ncbi:subtilisin-like protein, partial [Nadsonia fulvescens var. elongata DSM 6958]
GIKKRWSLSGSLVGYSIKLPSSAISILSRRPEVLLIEPESIIYNYDFSPINVPDDVAIQSNAGWGMARLAQRQQLKPVRNINKFVHNTMDGKGVKAYILDTGIYLEHSEFDPGRVTWGTTFVSTNPDERDSEQDLNGHGTHVAGIFGGKTYGIAKMSSIIAVKVLDQYGAGVVSDIMSGIEWATEQHLNDSLHNDGSYKGAIINLSLGLGKFSPALNHMIELCSHFDINIVVAAGNRNSDACFDSPASSPYVITVAATTAKDMIAPFSNHGGCVDIFAPGLYIPSAYNSGPYSTASGSGTSCSAPAIAGLIAYLLSLSPSAHSEFGSDQIMKPVEVKSRLKKFATRDALFGLPVNTTNLIGYTGGGYDWKGFYH